MLPAHAGQGWLPLGGCRRGSPERAHGEVGWESVATNMVKNTHSRLRIDL